MLHLEFQPRILSRRFEVAGDFPDELGGGLLVEGCLPEDRQGGKRFAVDVLGFENGNHLSGELRDRRGASLFGVEEGQVQGHQRSVVAHAPGDELPARREEKRCRSRRLVERREDQPSVQVSLTISSSFPISRESFHTLGSIALASSGRPRLAR